MDNQIHIAANIVAWLIPIVVLLAVVLPSAVRILREYERAVVFRLGKLIHAKGPGVVFLIPMVDRMVRMDLRVITINVAKQEIMTRDNVPATVDAVIYFRILDPEAAVVKVENYLQASTMIAQTTLRSVLGQCELDELLSHRDKINQTLQEIIDRHTGPWGVKVTAVEVRDVSLPDTMKRAMARQAETERERRAKIINAEGEFQAAEKLVQAATMIASQPIALQLRYLQTIAEIAGDRNTATIIPLPIELLTPFLKKP
ncbi:MAG TPA: SPFH domain-containing protein [Verrucomicrobiae bacterium]|jgi:regulator of protease activity HflC (stomatin/prohibitin superfamily)|nr:SPFH domain-containing protein [Verrucomicrobiae bacterium]